uniref:Peptidase S1 domain-containing protein n=1 Tax=Equus caballus TaxID=9796 RepID=A0A9L0SJ69_HORSE
TTGGLEVTDPICTSFLSSGLKESKEEAPASPTWEPSWKDAASPAPAGLFTVLWGRGSSIKVTLGAHNIQKQERTQQVISVKKAIPHPDYNPKNLADDIMLLKLEREAKLTAAVRTLSLPWGTGQVRPGEMCHVAG